MLDHEFVPTFHGTNWPTEEMVVFYVGFAQRKMGVKIYERTMIEWNFEDIYRCSSLEHELAESSPVHWVVIQLRKKPMWNAKRETMEHKRTQGSWHKDNLRSHAPPTDKMRDHFVDARLDPRYQMDPETPEQALTLHLALHAPVDTWIKYFQCRRPLMPRPTAAAHCRSLQIPSRAA